MIEGQIVPSSISGRYAIDDPNEGRDLSSGDVLEIFLDGQWIQGSIEYAPKMYTNMGMQFLGEPLRMLRMLDGYFFVARSGGICGLCAGMQIRVPD